MTATISRHVDTTIETLWRSHHQEVRSFVRRRCPSESVDDIVAETFASATAALAAGSNVDVGWLMTVARRRLADHWRQTERANRLTERLTAQRNEHTTFDEYHDAFEWLLGEVPHRQRQALVLRYSHGYSVGGIATALRTSYNGAESLLARAKSRLQAELLGEQPSRGAA